MNTKKSLEKRIRGWFPQKPILGKVRFKVTYETKPQPRLVIPPGFNNSATKIAGFWAIFWVILGTIQIIEFSSLTQVSLVSQGIWIVVGLIVGLSLDSVYTQRLLNQLSKNYQYYPNKKDTLLLAVPIVVFFLSGLLGSMLYYGFSALIKGAALTGWLTSVYVLVISALAIRYFLLVAFEKRKKMRLMSAWFQQGIYAIPKAPQELKI